MQNLDTKAANILYVDDEELNLKVFQASFRRDYNVFTAATGDEGLRIFHENDIQVIVTDQRMPGMTGVQFLQHLSEEPDNVRIILTGYSDMDAIIEAINTGKVYRYITKPWDKNELKITLDNALETVMLRRNIKKLIQELKEYNHDLEEKVNERTAEIEVRKNEQMRLIEEKARMETEFANKEKEVAERTALLKQQFMANMSHEIRTPMNAIVGMTRLLMEKTPRQDQMRYLNPIQLSANNLLVIINDILDLSKIEAGKIIIEDMPFVLRDVATCIYEMLALKAEEKGLRFSVNVAPGVPANITGDPTRLNQVLVNLAGNAIKFTQNGFVEINIAVDKTDGAGTWIRFNVADSGIGIGADHIDSIFDRFTQAGTDVTRKFGGTGLGLTISKQLVALMGGTLSVTSQLHQGTTFAAVIPFKTAVSVTDDNRLGKPDAAMYERLTKLKILLAEDNEFNRMVAEDTLIDVIPGVTLTMASNGQEAIEYLYSEPFDVVLMDIQMPVMDGVTATGIIRNELPAPAKHVKIVAMTANVLQEEVKQYFIAGMDAYVSKPFDKDELVMKLDEVMNGAKPMNQLKENGGKQIQELSIPISVINRDEIVRLIGNNRERQAKYIKGFLEFTPKLLSSVEESLLCNDLAMLRATAHSLKPQLSIMGIKEEVSNIAHIEQIGGGGGDMAQLPALCENLQAICAKAFEELKEFYGQFI